MGEITLFFGYVDYGTLASFILAAAILGISPGPDNIFVLTQSLAHGVKSGLAVVFGLVSGCLVHTTLLAFGVSEIIKRSDTLFWMIKCFGAIYLLYLAIKVFRRKSEITLSKDKTLVQGVGKLYWTGFTMNVLNPKVTIFFLAFFPGFLFSDSMGTVLQFYILGILFMMVTLVIFGSIALLSGGISNFVAQNSNTGTVFKWLQIVVFVGISFYLLLSDK